VRIGLLIFTIAVLSVLMSVHLVPDRIDLHPGEISDREVTAPRNAYYVSTERTNQAQLAARLATRLAYDTDEGASYGAGKTVQEFFDRIESERMRLQRHVGARPGGIKPITLAQLSEELQPQFASFYTKEQLRLLLSASPALFDKMHETASRLIAEAEEREIRDYSEAGRRADDLQHVADDVSDAARDSLSSPEYAAIVHSLARQSLRPNRLFSRRKTLAAQDAAARAVPPVSRNIVRGEKIVGVGERVTPEHQDKFLALGLLNPHMEPTTGAAICVLSAAMVLLVVYAIRRTLPRLYVDRRRLALLAVIVLLSILGLKVGGTMLGVSFSAGQVGYLGLMSVAAAGMLVSVLLDMHLAVLVVALLAVQSGLIMNHEIRFTVMTLLSSLVGIMSVGNVRRKTNLPATTAALAGTNLCLVWLLGLLLKDPLPELWSGSAWAVGSAVFAAFLYWFGLLVLERPFGILTHTALLELSAFDRPLLKDLCTVAPGTYAHSIMVGTLAEAGAQAVGADALLCRVAGYYHDIGKMKMPDFFVENQRRGDNVHGRLSASLSALIITAHVRDGVQMAQEQRLPAEIRDIVAQHHGTTLISYFYHQALADCGGETPIGLEERFRYPGPKPQTREAAVVMMADSVEAATRSLEKPSRERLEAEVARIIQGKIEDHQLDECDLTFRDIKCIGDAFLHVLAAMNHGRIAYPALPPKNATGHPMEVRRPDLNPEAPQLMLPSLPVALQPIANELAQAGGDNGGQGGAEASDTPQPTYRVVRSVGLPYEETPSEEIGASEPGVKNERSLPEPEIPYGRLVTERHPAPNADGQSAESSPTPVTGRGTAPRRGKRPIDR
jgi:putative nucleotidyltransferase with HDIG domain